MTDESVYTVQTYIYMYTQVLCQRRGTLPGDLVATASCQRRPWGSGERGRNEQNCVFASSYSISEGRGWSSQLEGRGKII